MNKYQRLAIIVALIDALIMVFFPPFNNQPLAKGVLPSFDGFYPLLAQLGGKPLYKELLTLQLIFVGVNTLSAWLVLQSKKHHDDIPDFSFTYGIGWFLLVNLAVIFTFPPFEPYQSLVRSPGSSFDSFYFIFGHRSQRPFFAPLLYLECVFVVVNALAFWLLFNAVKRNDEATRQRIMQLTEDLPDDALQKISEDIQHKLAEHQAPSREPLGRGEDRRHNGSGYFPGNERRSGRDRREH